MSNTLEALGTGAEPDRLPVGLLGIFEPPIYLRLHARRRQSMERPCHRRCLGVALAAAFGTGARAEFPLQLIQEANASIFYDDNMGLQTVHGVAADQMRHGMLRGEQTILIGVFIAGVVMLFERGFTPIGPLVMILL
jgi:hypothetical protein